MNDPVILVLVAILPSIVVFLTAFYLIRQFIGMRMGERIGELKKEDHKHVLPLRLQAYERLVLLLERIAPGPMVLRVHTGSMTSRMLHGELIATIREEFDHNLTQQIYVSDKAWSKVRQAREETIRLINMSYEQTGDVTSGTELSRRIFENVSRLSHTPSQEVILALKEEVRRLF